ncbi:hypothetical protein [Paenarthrobacter sp. NPDC090522]|uniref:hypothetical protein n=1 Tax=Paenarthrobacter sp. NPDC090522 TaxID=3364383 RepID=UPI0038010125
MKICFIGDSHLGHIMPTWKERAASEPSAQASFHIERTYGTLPLTLLVDSEKVAEFTDISCAYSAEVEVENYDAFIVFGMHYSFTALAKTHIDFRSARNRGNGDAYLLSDSAYSAMIEELYQFSKAKRVIDSLKAHTKKPIFYAQQPMPLEWVIKRSEKNLSFFEKIVASDDIKQLLESYEDSLNQLQFEGVRILRQPSQTLSMPGFTKSEFGLADINDTSPESPYSKGDYFHMNSSYGELVTNDILDIVVNGMGE